MCIIWGIRILSEPGFSGLSDYADFKRRWVRSRAIHCASYILNRGLSRITRITRILRGDVFESRNSLRLGHSVRATSWSRPLDNRESEFPPTDSIVSFLKLTPAECHARIHSVDLWVSQALPNLRH